MKNPADLGNNIGRQVGWSVKRYPQSIEQFGPTILAAFMTSKSQGRGFSLQIIINAKGEKNGDIIRSLTLTARRAPDDIRNYFRKRLNLSGLSC